MSAARTPLAADDGIAGRRGLGRRSPPPVAGSAWSSCCSRSPPWPGGRPPTAWPGWTRAREPTLGALGWFLGVWVVMMAAMMLPSVAPTVALYARMSRRRTPVAPLVFAAGYLFIWTAAGVVAYGLFALGRSLLGDQLAWEHAGRWLAGGTLLVAAGYELTPLKDVCLSKCRSPLGFLLGSWRDGTTGALQHGRPPRRLVRRLLLGADGGAVRARRHEPGVDGLRRRADRAREDAAVGRPVTYATAAILVILGVVLLAAPDAVPGLTIPGNDSMGSGGVGQALDRGTLCLSAEKHLTIATARSRTG